MGWMGKSSAEGVVAQPLDETVAAALSRRCRQRPDARRGRVVEHLADLQEEHQALLVGFDREDGLRGRAAVGDPCVDDHQGDLRDPRTGGEASASPLRSSTGSPHVPPELPGVGSSADGPERSVRARGSVRARPGGAREYPSTNTGQVPIGPRRHRVRLRRRPRRDGAPITRTLRCGAAVTASRGVLQHFPAGPLDAVPLWSKRCDRRLTRRRLAGSVGPWGFDVW